MIFNAETCDRKSDEIHTLKNKTSSEAKINGRITHWNKRTSRYPCSNETLDGCKTKPFKFNTVKIHLPWPESLFF